MELYANGIIITVYSILMTRIQSWKKLTNRGNLVKPVSARFFARFRDILGVKVLREHDRLDAAWGRVLRLATNTIKHKTTCRDVRINTNLCYVLK